MNIPLGFVALDCDTSILLEHHPGTPAVLLMSTANAVQPYYIWCPACGFKVPGSTVEAAVSNWNDHLADPGRSVATTA